jgi:uncharacterized delta-60 repeat protein
MKNLTGLEGATRGYIIPAAAIAAGLACHTAAAAPGDLDASFGSVGRTGLLPGLDGAVWSLEASVGGQIAFGVGKDDESCEYSDYYSDYYSCFDDGFVGSVAGDGKPSSGYAGQFLDGFSVRDIARQSDRKVVAVGRKGSDFVHSLVIARFSQTGLRDESFGTGGVFGLPSATYSAAYSIEIDADDRVVVAGVEGSQVVVLRLGKDGALDESFGTAGIFRGPFLFARLERVEIEKAPGGYRVLSGTFDRCVVTAITASGQLDPRFGQLGTAAITSRDGSRPVCTSMAAGADGSLVIGGHDGSGALALRLRPDGSADPGFAGSDLRAFRSITSLAIEPNGSVLLGVTEDDARQGALVVRVLPDGRIDPSYGSGGRARIELESNTPTVMRTRVIRLQPDGRVLVGGLQSVPSPRPFLARLVTTGGGPGVLGFVTMSAEVSETDQRAVVRVGRSGGSTGAVSVRYDTAAVSAQAGSDFAAATGRLDWADGDASERSITVPIAPGDASVEPPEQFTVVISQSGGGAGLGLSAASVTIRGDGYPYGVLSIGSSVTTRYPEPAVAGTVFPVQIAIRRDDYSTGAVSVRVSPQAGTATAGEDFQMDPVVVSWADGDVGPRSVTANILRDRKKEGDETFSVVLSSPTGGALLNTSSVTVTIADTPHGGSSGGGGRFGLLSLLLLGLTKLWRRKTT